MQGHFSETLILVSPALINTSCFQDDVAPSAGQLEGFDATPPAHQGADVGFGGAVLGAAQPDQGVAGPFAQPSRHRIRPDIIGQPQRHGVAGGGQAWVLGRLAEGRGRYGRVRSAPTSRWGGAPPPAVSTPRTTGQSEP